MEITYYSCRNNLERITGTSVGILEHRTNENACIVLLGAKP